MVKISYTNKKNSFLDREREREKKKVSRILLFHSEIGRRQL